MIAAPSTERLSGLFGPLRLPAKYVPIEPTLKQDWFLRHDQFEVFFGGAAGPGKLLSCSTPIPTPSGWTTIGEIRVGDEVFGEDGNACAVEWISDVDLRPESYRLTLDDGSEFEACADHLWLTFDAKELGALTRRDPVWRAARRARRPSRAAKTLTNPSVSALTIERNKTANPSVTLDAPTGTVRTTREIAETLTTPTGRRNHAIPVAQPLDLPDADLPIDPYVLGAWLGDGTTKSGTLTAHPDDHPHFFEHLARYEPHAVKCPKTIATYGLQTDLRRAGVLGNKHVPAVYLRGSVAQRLALLQGLMDTDGYVDEVGYAEFTSTLERLALAVFELAASLGQKPKIAEGRATLNGFDYGPKWRVTWTPTIPVFRLPRKLARQNAAPRRTNRFRYVVSCVPIPPKPMRCIRVSNPSRLFLAGRAMVPTHNSWALLMAALQYVDVPGYHALLLRPELTQFEMQGGLIEVSTDWLSQTDAHWNGTKRQWTFPSGATLKFGYLKTLADLSHYAGGGISFVGFDELTLFYMERIYTSMVRVLRQPLTGILEDVPVRVRSASNPGNVGHSWVKARFIEAETREPGAVFIPGRITDNPHLDYDTYLKTLSHLHPVDRMRLIQGDWDVTEEGGKFRRQDFRIVDPSEIPAAKRRVRYWDLAASEPTKSNPDPDWTVGLLYELGVDDRYTVVDVRAVRKNDDDVEALVRATAVEDGRATPVYVEQDPGQAGKAQLTNYQRRVLAGYACHRGMTRINGRNAAKEVRARPVAAAVGNDLVRINAATPNLRLFLDQVSMFPMEGTHDDCVDALSGAHNAVTDKIVGEARTSVPQGRIPSAGVGRLSAI